MGVRLGPTKAPNQASATSFPKKGAASARQASPFPALASPREQLLSLQRTHGNRAVRRIIRTYSQLSTDTPETQGQTIDRSAWSPRTAAHVLQRGADDSVVRRKIKFATKPPVREDPIDKILRGEPAVGLTTPTVNGKQPADVADAETLLSKALSPKQTSYDAASKECTVNDFEVSISANVQIFTEPEDGKWRKYVRGSSLRDAAACTDLENVPVVMKGKPSSESVEKLIAANEQEHVDDLKSLHGQHLESHFNELASMKGKGDSSKTCSDDIRATAGSKRAGAITNFLQAWRDSVTNRDEGGKHTLKTKTTVKDKCVRVEIEAQKR